MKEKKTVVKNKTWTDRQVEMVKMLQAEHGINSFSTIIDMAVTDMFSKTFPAYRASSVSGRGVANSDTVEGKAKMKIMTKNAEKDFEEKARWEEKTRICEKDLYGEVGDGDHGKVCRFNTYYADGKVSKQQVPLQQAHAILADTSLFIPSRAVVLSSRPELVQELGIKT